MGPQIAMGTPLVGQRIGLGENALRPRSRPNGSDACVRTVRVLSESDPLHRPGNQPRPGTASPIEQPDWPPAWVKAISQRWH